MDHRAQCRMGMRCVATCRDGCSPNMTSDTQDTGVELASSGNRSSSRPRPRPLVEVRVSPTNPWHRGTSEPIRPPVPTTTPAQGPTPPRRDVSPEQPTNHGPEHLHSRHDLHATWNKARDANREPAALECECRSHLRCLLAACWLCTANTREGQAVRDHSKTPAEHQLAAGQHHTD